MKERNFTDDVRLFTEAVGCTTDRFNVRQTALYFGLQAEELCEKVQALVEAVDQMESIELSAFAPLIHLRDVLHDVSNGAKAGAFDKFVEHADRAAMLDADIDLAWVTIGSALSQGADVDGACREVARANLAKLVPCDEQHLGINRPLTDCPKCGGKLLYAVKDANGKVTKPAGWTAPDITPFVCLDGAA